MHILITGAAGLTGRKLPERLVREAALNGRPIAALSLLDVVAPSKPPGFAGEVRLLTADLAAEGEAARAIAARPEVIFHLAGVVSAEAELDFDKGYHTNLDGTRALFGAIRHSGDGYRPKLVYTSSRGPSVAPSPHSPQADSHPAPLPPYGPAKAMGELLLADYTRRGFCDGIGLRLPAICVRPGKPNLAASGFFSSIIREPLAGAEALLPVAETVRHTHASPRAAVGMLIHAAGLPRGAVRPRSHAATPSVARHA